MDCAILNDMFIDDDAKYSDKRAKHLLRESERDSKRASMGLAGAGTIVEATNLHLEERAESLPVTTKKIVAPSPAPALVIIFN